mmetsp:Transcript_13475/g.15101  ORF Transcript_13475/g.15101 Transcript_13475/m.15101 type:complete len:554 (+) Transcript_13475:63-1724(+)
MSEANIKEPHNHDVLSGRGNFVNYHDGNEYFRKLVQKYKLEYVKSPKQQKGKFSKIIVDDIKARNPPGRFLRLDKDTKLWWNIGEKKALDKTRQALREGAPEIMKDTKPEEESAPGGTNNSVQKKKPSLEQLQQQQLHNSELSILQQSIMSNFDGTDSLSNGMRNGLIAAGLSPGMLASPLYSPGMMMSVSNNSATPSSSNMSQRFGNRMGGMDLSQIIPPPQVHQPQPNQSTNMLSQQQQQQQQQQEKEVYLLQEQRKQQERQLQLLHQQQYLQQQQKQQQQQQQQQSRNHQFTTQQEQELLMQATAVMGNGLGMINSPQQQRKQQQQPEQIHMDQLRINKLQEKQLLLQHEINQHRQLEEQLRKQQEMDHQQQQHHKNPSEMQKLQSRLGEIYDTDAFFDPVSIRNQTPEAAGVGVTGAQASSQQDTNDDEKSLKMESLFENDPAPTGKKKYNESTMSMSGTSLSLEDLGDENELSALFDTSMKISGNYTVSLNDNNHNNNNNNRGPRSPPTPPSKRKVANSATLFEKSNSSMSCDSSLSRLFEEEHQTGK